VLEAGRTGFAQLRLERPLLAAAGDRFVLRSVAPPDTIGGGRVLDPQPSKHGRGEVHARRLRALGSGDPLELLRLQIEAAPSGLDGAGRSEELQRLAVAGDAVAAGRRTRRWFTPRLFDRARAGLLAAVGAGDDPRPRSPAALAHAAGLDAQGAAAVLETLSAEGEVERRDAGYVRVRPGPAPPDPLAQKLLELLVADDLEPRSVAVLAAEAGVSPDAAAEALERLAATGGVTRVKPGIYFHPRALERVRGEVVSLCERDGAVTIASLRDRLATSRKYSQALLEHFDAARITRRVGDQHVLRRAG
jgi:selenocysteine-specific elongation factor